MRATWSGSSRVFVLTPSCRRFAMNFCKDPMCTCFSSKSPMKTSSCFNCSTASLMLVSLLIRGQGMGKQLRTSRHRALMAALVAARESAGLSQRELAKRSDRAHSFVGKIESGERQLNVLEFCEYADVLGADAAELLRSVAKGKG